MKKNVGTLTGYGILLFSFIILSISSSFAQSIRLKSNSEKHFKITFIGTGKEGKEVRKVIDDVDLGYWKTISLYKTKYGYDLYNNNEMKSDGADATNRWKMMIVTDSKTSATDELDITKSLEGKKLANNHIWVRLKHKYDNDYLLTYISLFDHRMD